MTLYTLVNILKSVALSQPNVRMATDGSIYDKLNATNSVKYDVVHFSQTKHIEDEETDTYGFNIFYVSRLEDSLEDNRLQIQSIGKEVLGNILRSFCENWSIDFPEIIYYPFTQKFADLCAGVYCRVEIEVPKEIICADDYIEEVAPSKGIKLENILVEIDQNGTREVTPSPGFDGIGKVTIVTDVPGGASLEYKEVEYTENGDYTILPSSGYDGLSEVAVSISVPQGQGYEEGYADGVADQKAKLTVTSLTENNTYTSEDGWSAVTVNVPSDYQDGYDDGVADQKAKLSSTSVTENGTYTREDGYSAFTVDVDTVNNQSKTYTFTENNTQIVQSAGGDYYLYGGEVIRPDSGYTGLDKATISLQANIQDLYDSGYTDGYAAGTGVCSGFLISAITLTVPDTIENSAMATVAFSPATAYTDIYFTSSDPSKAAIDEKTGAITIFANGNVTFCAIDRLTGLRSCQTSLVYKTAYSGPFEVIYDVSSTTNPTQILESYGRGRLYFDYFTYDGVDYEINKETTGFTFPTIGRHTVSYHYTTPVIGMAFWGCDRLVEAHIPGDIIMFDSTFVDTSLSAVTLNEGLVNITDAFRNTDLINVTLPDTVQTIGELVFANCTSLSSITMGDSVDFIGDNAFKNCTSLTGLTFPATLGTDPAPASRIYGWAFCGCTALSHLTFLSEEPAFLVEGSQFTDTNNCPIYVPATAVATYKGQWGVWKDRIVGDYTLQPLTFNIISGGTINWKTSNGISKTIQYSLDNGGNWTSITSTDSGSTFNVNAGDKVMFRGDNATYNGSVFCGTTAIFEVEGNIMSLIDSENFATATTLVSSNTFNSLFSYCTDLTSAENLVLPAIALTDSCYNSMFRGCASLTTVPELPATTLAQSCYNNMFSYCSSLTTAPALPATTLANSCYQNMLRSCTSLTTAPELPATALTQNCYYGMFWDCSSLTTVPELPATTLAQSCYNNMFRNCTALNYIKCLATDISASNCTNGWVYSVSSTGTFVKDPNMSDWEIGSASGIPENWTIIDNT